MGNIKVIPNLKPWEVMERANDGEPVAYRDLLGNNPSPWEATTAPSWNWEDFEFAIIDASVPIIDWMKFNWGFFNQYGGLMVDYPDCGSPVFVQCALPEQSNESPTYYWPGGSQPVPDNVEVRVIFNSGDRKLALAKDFMWSWASNSSDIIAFSITGDIL